MQKLRPLKPKKLIKLLEEFGFKPVRQKGSHLILKNGDGKTTVVPMHSSEEIDVSLISSILRECGIDRKRFLEKD